MLAPRLHVPLKKRTIRASAHPAARGKPNEERFRDCYPFSEANDFMKSQKLKPVTWDLPAALG